MPSDEFYDALGMKHSKEIILNDDVDAVATMPNGSVEAAALKTV